MRGSADSFVHSFIRVLFALSVGRESSVRVVLGCARMFDLTVDLPPSGVRVCI